MTCLERRLAGVLLHPTSLPGPHGSGDFGASADHFVDWLAEARQSVWQVLPLTPVGPGYSPYASVSAFAGSPLLIAIDPLVDLGWLDAEAARPPDFDERHVDFAAVTDWRMNRLRQAAEGFRARGTPAQKQAFAAFCRAQAYWLDDYALFMALDDHHRRRQVWTWTAWEAPLARRDPAALREARQAHADAVAFWQFVQWCFVTQWQRVKAYANARGVRLVGDLPIFVAHHSADCWARPDLFLLDEAFAPTVVAGVPPDLFAADGQRWGNPLYDWQAMQRDGFAWWIARLKHELTRADIVRIDHFRGFAGYWEIPADAPTARTGRWVPAPGTELFKALRAALGTLPVIAEDLGVITPDVEALRDDNGLPGMKILQFAFGDGASNPYLPHNLPVNACVYTGSHDNDTVQGWWKAANPAERAYATEYLATPADGHDAHWAMIRAAWGSVARLAVCPFQDVLGLGSEHRMNTPGRLDCWTWRFSWNQVGPQPARRLGELTTIYGRTGEDAMA